MMIEDLSYIRKRIIARSEFQIRHEDTFAPKLYMICFGFEVSISIKRDEISSLWIYGSNTSQVEANLREILVNDFISSPYLKEFIKLENRERNLNILTND